MKESKARKVWRISNPERVSSYKAIWEAKHPRHQHAPLANHKARVRGVEGTITTLEVEQLFEKYDNKCNSCGTPDKLTLDHVVSLYNKGINRPENIQVLCKSCNSKKGSGKPHIPHCKYGHFKHGLRHCRVCQSYKDRYGKLCSWPEELKTLKQG